MATPFLLPYNIIKTSPHTLKIGYNQITPSQSLLRAPMGAVRGVVLKTLKILVK